MSELPSGCPTPIATDSETAEPASGAGGEDHQAEPGPRLTEWIQGTWNAVADVERELRHVRAAVWWYLRDARPGDV